MRSIRPFAWVIIAVNLYFAYIFLKGVLELEKDNLAVGAFTLMFLFIWAVINVILYVIYRVTGRAKARLCPACASNVRIGITKCSKCGFDFMKTALGIDDKEQAREAKSLEKTNQSVESSTSEVRVQWKIPVLAFAVVSIFIAFFSSQTNSQDNWSDKKNQVSENIQDYTIDNSWIPSGFLKYQENIAIRYLKNPKCTYSDSLCVGIKVASKEGCPNNLYGEISIQNKKGVQIGYSNDSLSSLSPGQIGELIFDILDWERFGNFKLTKISCY